MRLFRRKDPRGQPTGPWYAQWFDADGRRHEKSTRAFDRKAAETIARTWERAGADPASAAASEATLIDTLTALVQTRHGVQFHLRGGMA